MYGAVREFQGPTGVTHALRGRFGSPGSPGWGIVFIKRNSIELYHVRANNLHARMQMLAVSPLPAAVISVAALKRVSVPADFLWVGFSAMRIAALAWDPSIQNWQTVQAVDLAEVIDRIAASQNTTGREQRPMSNVPGEGHRVLIHGRYSNRSTANMRIDSNGRCVAVLANELGLLLVLPLRSDEELSAAVSGLSKLTDPEPLVHEGDMYIVDLKEAYGVANVKDFVFLDDYFEPTVLILHEPKRTWSGRAAVQRNTAQLVAVSLDLRSKSHSKTWAMDKLPYDSHQVVGVPEASGGGVLVLSPNILMQVRHEVCVAGLSLNSFGDSYSEEMSSVYDKIVQSKTLLSLDSARFSFLDPLDSATALVSLKGGELYFLSLAVAGRCALSLERAGSTVLASAIVPVNDRFFVLASRISDSLLIEFRKATRSVAIADEAVDSSGTNAQNGKWSEAAAPLDALSEPDGLGDGLTNGEDGNDEKFKKSKRSKKRRRTVEEEAEYEMLYGSKPPPESDSEDDSSSLPHTKALELVDKDEGTRGVYDDDDELGMVFSNATDARREKKRSEEWALKVKDTLTCYGPAADVAVGRSVDDASGALDLVVAGGYAKNGCLGVIQHSIRSRDITRFSFEEYSKAWTLRDPSIARRESLAREARNAARVSKNADIRARNAKRLAARQRRVTAQVDKLKSATVDDVKPATDNDIHVDLRESGLESPNSKRHKTGDENAKSSDFDRLRPKGESAATFSTKNSSVSKSQNKLDQSHGPVTTNDAGQPRQLELETPELVAIDGNKLAAIEAEAASLYPLEIEEEMEESIADETALHSYLLLTNGVATVAMSTGEDLEQLSSDSVKFVTSAGTIAAGNVLCNVAIVQVHSGGVRVLKDGNVHAEHRISESSSQIAEAHISDPYVVLQFANGCISVLKVIAEELRVADKDEHSTSAERGETLYDEYGMETCTGERVRSPSRSSIGSENKPENRDSGSHEPSTMFSRNGAASVDYRNIEIKVVFKYEPSQSGQRIASAGMYRGSLANGIGRKVVAENDTQRAKVTEAPTLEPLNGGGLEAGDGAPAKSEEDVDVIQTESIGSAKDAVEEMDEEERMLYGDADEDMGTSANARAAIDDANSREGDVSVDATAGMDLSDDIRDHLPGSAQDKLTSTSSPEAGVLPLSEGQMRRENDFSLLVTVSKDGALEMRSSASNFGLVFRCSLFFLGPSVVSDEGCDPAELDPVSGHQDQPSSFVPQKALKAKKKDRVVGLIMTQVTGTTLVPGLCTTILVAVQASGFPLIYRGYVAPDSPTQGLAKSNICLTRVSSATLTTGMLSCISAGTESNCLVAFENIAGRGGIFVGGLYPFFVFAERGYPRMHPLRYNSSPRQTMVRRGVTSLSELHNVNCPRGFVYVFDGGVVGVGELPSPAAINMDSSAPFRKVVLRCTPHKVAYHAGSSTYGVLASMPTLTSREERLARILQSLEKHDKRHYQSTVAQAEAETGDEKASRVPPLYEEVHELRVYRPDGWQLIKSYKLQKGEVGLAIANVSVDVYKQRGANSGVHIPSTNRGEDGGETLFAASLKTRPKNMLVVGTGFLNGEDATSRGRLLMFEISRQEAYSDASGGYTAFQLQLIAEKELPGPVTAVASMEGYVVCGVGPQLGVYKLVKDEIVHLSFAFGQLFCTSIASIKQYVLSADMYKSIAFHFFRDRNTSINFLAKDYAHAISYATEFLINGEHMSMLMSDGEGNIHLFNFANAMVPESRGGKRLLPRGGVNLGSRVNKFQRVRILDPSTIARSENLGSKLSGCHASMFVTLDGGLGAVVPIDEGQLLQLESLAKEMASAQDVPRHGGLDPRDSRAFRPRSSSTQLLEQRLVDTRLPFEVLELGPARSRTASSAAGTTLADVVVTAALIDRVLERF